MSLINQVIVEWTGFKGQPGYSVFYVDNNYPGTRDSIAAFFSNISSEFPPSVFWTIPSEGDIYDAESGDLQAVGWTHGAPISYVGTALGPNFAAPAGACVTWHCSTTAPATVPGKRPHRVRGRTFLVPMTNVAFQSDGTLVETARDLILTKAAELLTSANGHLVIWAKPVYTKEPPITQTRVGSKHTIVAATVTDQVATLKTRR